MEEFNDSVGMVKEEKATEPMQEDDSSSALTVVKEEPVDETEDNTAPNESEMTVNNGLGTEDRHEKLSEVQSIDNEEEKKKLQQSEVVSDNFETNSETNTKKQNEASCENKETSAVPAHSEDAPENEDAPVLMEYREGGSAMVIEDSADSSPDSSTEDEAEDKTNTAAVDPSTQINQTISNERDQSPDRDRRVKLNRYGFEDVRTKGEILPEELPPLEELTITVDESVVMKEVGNIKSIVGVLVVIQSNENISPLNDDSILFVDGHKVLGQVFEVFGPVKKPWYSVRFNDIANITNKGLEVGMKVYCAPNEEAFTRYVFMENLKNMRGSDASWEDNNEPPEKHLEYSDDEAEKTAKSRKKKGGAKQGEGAEAGDHGNKRKRNRNAMNKDGDANLQSNSVQHGNQRRNPFQGSSNHNPNPRYASRPQSNHGNSGSQRWPPGPSSAQYNRPPPNFGGPPRFQPNNKFSGYQQNFGNFVPQLNTGPQMVSNNSQSFPNSVCNTGPQNSSGFRNNSQGKQMNQVQPIFGHGGQGSSIPPDFTRPPPPFIGNNQSFNQHQANMGQPHNQPSTMLINQPLSGMGIQTCSSNPGQYGNIGVPPNLNNSSGAMPYHSGQYTGMQPLPVSCFQSPQVVVTNAGQQNQSVSGSHGFLPSGPNIPGMVGSSVSGIVNSNSQRSQFWNLNQQSPSSVQNNIRNITSPANPVSSDSASRSNYNIANGQNSSGQFSGAPVQTSINSLNNNMFGQSSNSSFTRTDRFVNSSMTGNIQHSNRGFQGFNRGPFQGPNIGGFQGPSNMNVQGVSPFQYMGSTGQNQGQGYNSQDGQVQSGTMSFKNKLIDPRLIENN